MNTITKENNTPDIDTAIAYYNLHKDKNELKMTKKLIASLICPDLEHGSALTYLTKWSKGKELGSYKMEHALRLVMVTGFPLKRLHNYVDLELS